MPCRQCLRSSAVLIKTTASGGDRAGRCHLRFVCVGGALCVAPQPGLIVSRVRVVFVVTFFVATSGGFQDQQRSIPCVGNWGWEMGWLGGRAKADQRWLGDAAGRLARVATTIQHASCLAHYRLRFGIMLQRMQKCACAGTACRFFFSLFCGTKFRLVVPNLFKKKLILNYLIVN